ncbi:YbaB/EbfC family nucleoid-associated protein [Microbacterium sp. NPDC076768]|uniref:YbaB/EbfC family nucleoid-associated protein n=1 Tax=Microbacterium sp. NPDC076768 TaxID=3154858 RepID=UPI0034495F20
MTNTFDFSDPIATRERILQQVQDAERRAAQAAQVRDDIASVRERATSPGRDVAVTVDSSGRLAEVKLTDAALGRSPEALGALIVSLAGQAQRKAGERAVSIAADAFGAEDAVVEHLRDEIAQLPDPSQDGQPKIEYR